MKKQTNKPIDTLRKFFQLSTLAFEFQEKIAFIFGSTTVTHSEMRVLHKLAHDEMSKETPDLEIIDKLLSRMERVAQKNKDNGQI